MAKVLSCVAHNLTPEQLAELEERRATVDYLKQTNPELFAALTQCPDDREQLREDSIKLWHVIKNGQYDWIILPIGSPAFMWEFAAMNGDLLSDRVLFAHSVREVVEKTMPDGSVEKTNIFKHVRFF